MTNLIRNAGFVLIAAALFACGGDDDDSTGAGGSGATAGSAGSAGSTAGTAGTGGSGATAGTGGSNGGTGGSTAGTGGGGTGGGGTGGGGTGGGGTGGGGTGGGGTGGGGTGGGGTGGSAGTGAVAGTGGSGGDPCAGAVGTGPDGCWLCAEFTEGCFDPATLCAEEAPLFQAAYECACTGACAAVCGTPGNYCETGDALGASGECQACVLGTPAPDGCAEVIGACQAGATPTCDPMLTCAGALDPAGDPAMLCDGPEKDLYSAVYACGVANCANDCAPGGDPMACQICMGTNCGAELQACTDGAMNGPVVYDPNATFTIDCSAPAPSPSAGSCVFIDNAAYLCNPVTNEGCDGAAGQACDFNFDDANPGFQCYDPPNDAMLCDTCGANDGFCGGGLTCVSTGMATGCAKYCCDDSDCTSGQVCSHTLYGDAAPGVCAAP